MITGTFSYIKNNQRVDYELQSKMVEIVSADEVSDVTQPSFDGLDIDGMACVRTITDMGDNRYLVRLDVVNAELEGFCKIKTTSPAVSLQAKKMPTDQLSPLTAIRSSSFGLMPRQPPHSMSLICWKVPVIRSVSPVPSRTLKTTPHKKCLYLAVVPFSRQPWLK